MDKSNEAILENVKAMLEIEPKCMLIVIVSNKKNKIEYQNHMFTTDVLFANKKLTKLILQDCLNGVGESVYLPSNGDTKEIQVYIEQ